MRSAARLLIAVALVTALAGCGGADSRKVRALERGDGYLAAGKLDKARIEFRNALQLAPNDALSRYKNGVVQERLGNIREAFQFYQGAVAVDPELVAARTELARLFVFGGAPERALETLKPGLERHPDDAGLLTVRAAARAQLKDVAGAFEDAERAVKLDPKSESGVAVLAGLYNSNARSDRARELLEKAIRDLPASVDLRVALSQLYVSLHESGHAEALLRELVRIKPDDRASRIRLAQFLAGTNQAAAAENVLREAIAAMPKDRELKVALVELLGSRRGRAAAEEELKRWIAAEPGDAELRFTLARFYEQGNEPAKAEAVFREVVAREGTAAAGLTARSRLATLKISRKDTKAAQQLVGEVLAVNPRDSDALILRGNLLLAAGDPKGAIDDLRGVLRDQPDNVGVMRVLARAHVKHGEPALAEEMLRRAVDAAPGDPGARFDLGQLLIQLDRPEPAKTVLQQLAKERPNDIAVQEALFRASVASKDTPGAKVAAEAIRSADPHSAIGQLYAGMVAESEGKRDDALKSFRGALDSQPLGQEPLIALTRLLAGLKRVPEALQTLDAIAAAHPDYALPLNLKGELLLSQRRFGEADASFQQAIARAPKWWQPHRGRAHALYGSGAGAAAIKLLEQSVMQVDDPVPLRVELAQLLESAGRPEDAIGQYETILKTAPQAVGPANNLAMLLVTYRSDAASLARAADLSRSLAGSKEAPYLDTYGWVRFKQGDINAALPALEKAQAAAPDAPILQYHLGMAQAAAGDTAQARSNLERAVSSNSAFPGKDEARAALAKLAGARS